MKNIVVLSAALVIAASALSHHSNAGLDMESVVTIEGTVTEFSWRNPHVYFMVESTNEHGEQIEWTVQLASTITVTRMGWTSESLLVGDRVTVKAHAARNGRPYAMMDSTEKEGGIALPTLFDAVSAEPILVSSDTTASTSTIEGTWMADPAKLVSYPGGVDGFFTAQLRLTEQGQAAWASYNEISEQNPYARCIGSPTPTLIVLTNIFPLEIQINEDEETVIIRSEFLDDQRIVYMDGRQHAEGGERTFAGHSIGWWEGETLVVDTKSFADHRSPYQNGVPSGPQKHVVERYRLNDDGRRILVEFVLEDPEYLAEPLTHNRELIYAPQMEISRFDCDLEAARRFLPQ